MRRTATLAVLIVLTASCSSVEPTTGPSPTAAGRPLGDRPTITGLTEVPPFSPELDALPEDVVTLLALEGPEIELPVRVAADPGSRRAGLPGVTSFPAGAGVLITYDEPRAEPYTPDELGTEVDAVFVGSSLVVLAVVAGEPCAGDCAALDPGTAYVAVLLVPRGWVAGQGLTPPLRVVIPGA